jgi:hypothetical protein
MYLETPFSCEFNVEDSTIYFEEDATPPADFKQLNQTWNLFHFMFLHNFISLHCH